jgi:hypothetical protein
MQIFIFCCWFYSLSDIEILLFTSFKQTEKDDDVYRIELISRLIDKIVNERQIKNEERTKNMTGNSSKPVENINDSHSQLKMAQKRKY